MASSDLVKATQVSETRSTDLAAVWPLAAVANQVYTHLTLGGFDGGVCLARRHGVTLGEEQEVVDESFHVLLHSRTRGRADLVVLNLDRTSGHLVQTLVDDAKRLTELLHTAEVSVVAVTVDTDGDVKLNLVISIVGLRLADVPRDARATEHNTGETHVQRILSAHNSNTLGSGLPDTVVRKQLLSFVNAVTELGRPLVDVIEQAKRNILGDTARADICSVETGTRDSLIEFLYINQGQ